MDKQAAIKIIRDTFENPFDKGRFVHFAKNLLNKIDEEKAFHAHAYVPESFKGYVKTYERIGTYTDFENNKIDILIVYLQKETSLERARTSQRNFVARYLKDRGEKEAGLIAFVSPDPEDWRFSLVKMDYLLEESPSGKIKVKTELTPARRWSFLVGQNESSHTAQAQLLPILQDDQGNPMLADLEGAFNIEVVTREFFGKYRALFLDVKESLEGILSKDKKIRDDFTVKGVDTVNFSKKLLGQIVFLYFLQKKGWFGVGRDEDWGTGPKGFLRLLFEQKVISCKNFFNDILEPLFYEALALKRPDDFYQYLNCKIPFLNGGLFDPINDYDWVHTDILLPDQLFSNIQKTKEGDVGTGILDVFDRYNFTVKEDEPLDKEVAVDPEMLGKIFEKLCGVNSDNFEEWSQAIKSNQKSVETKFNKKHGIYYTPREVVHYMCQESLIDYLATELQGKVDRGEISTFIRHGEVTIENDLAAARKLDDIRQGRKKRSDYKLKLSPAVSNNARMIDDKLKMIRICDPAVGSGAFPVGMMHEIVKARKVLNLPLGDTPERSAYQFKRDCIQNCLYGVDTDPGAVQIAKLRLWLSLVVDEEDIKHISPLPNLDYKIMQGNSLLEKYEGIKLFDDKLTTTISLDNGQYIKDAKEKLSDLQREYFQLLSEGRLTAANKQLLEAEIKKKSNSLKTLTRPKEPGSDSAGLFDVFSEARKKADELRRLQQDIFGVTQKDQKDSLKTRIETLEWDLIEATLKEQGKISELSRIEQYKKANARPFFLWKLHFSEVFQEEGGFDVVIANPPYVRQEQIKELKADLQEYFSCYTGTTDLYVYFYERGFQLLREGGILTYISSNKYFRSGYGKKLRHFLGSKSTIHQLIDFGDAPVFEAIAYPSIIVLSKRAPGDNQTHALNWEPGPRIEEFAQVFQSQSFLIAQKELSDDGWRLESPAVLRLLEKLRNTGTPLKEYVNERFYRGVLTGLNEAFVVDRATRDHLIAEHPSSAEILKPFLIGHDLKRWYSYTSMMQYILFVPWHFPLQHDRTITGASEAAESEFKSRYPAAYNHLLKFKRQLESRNKDETGKRYEWYALQRCAATYHMEFEKTKIAWGNLAKKPQFTFAEAGHYINAPANLIVSDSKYLLGILNSKITEYLVSQSAAERQGGFLEFKPMYISPLAIPRQPEKEGISIVVSQILAITKDEDYHTNPTKQAKVKEYERQIDQMVYDLYGLTPEEIAVVEGSNKK